MIDASVRRVYVVCVVSFLPWTTLCVCVYNPPSSLILPLTLSLSLFLSFALSLSLSVSLPLSRSLSLSLSLTLVLRYVSLRIPERALREGRVPPGGCDPSSLTVPSFAIVIIIYLLLPFFSLSLSLFWFLGIITGSRRALMSPRTTKSKSHATSWFNRAAAGSSGSWSTPAPGRPASRSLCRWTFSSSARCPCHLESPWKILLTFARRRTWSCSAPVNPIQHCQFFPSITSYIFIYIYIIVDFYANKNIYPIMYAIHT